MHTQIKTMFRSSALIVATVVAIGLSSALSALADNNVQFGGAAPDPVREALSIPGRDLTQATFKRMPPPNSGLQNSDYMAEVRAASRDRTLHFTEMPIPIYIDPTAQPDVAQMCLTALHRWEVMTHQMVRFEVVPTPGQARILVRLHHQGFNASGTPKGAVTHIDWKLRNGHRNRASDGDNTAYLVPPQIIDVNLDIVGDRLPEAKRFLLTNVFSHEIGHALGLLGHSTVESDLLYKETDEYSRLSERDLNTLKKLYQTKADVEL